MRFGAIDIGSNAVRLLIADVIETEEDLIIKKLSLTRVPIRLGASVFEKGYITSSKAKKLAKTMKAFRYLLDVYGV
ncbi:MAG: exopolyphosphatase, partial [Cryomorphaceae bacterium]